MPNSVRRCFSLLAVAGLVAAYASCSSPTGPGTISGSWNANCGTSSSGCTDLELNESGSALSGIAEAQTGQLQTMIYTVTGTYDRPRVTLVLVPQNVPGTAVNTIGYEGTASGGTMTLRTVGSDPETVVYQRGQVAFPGGTDVAR